MLDEATRSAILTLHTNGNGTRRIAQSLGVARSTVRRVVTNGRAQVPPLERAEAADPWREQILELQARYEGHLGRVHEELVKRGATLSYPALTAFCRRHGLGSTPPLPAGHYEFTPAQEMQHDTSPHQAKIGGGLTRVQTASLVLCYSRMIFFQMYPRFARFECKAFLAQALAYFNGAAATCMIDNSSVIVTAGSGATMIAAPEMVAFAERYGFVFRAHEKGHANRSARVEAPFHRIERAFLTGEDFASWADLNARARATCDTWNSTFSNKLHASRRELFAVEQPRLGPLPLHVPEVYQIFTRIVDAEGYVHVNRIRYSAPYRLIGRSLEVRERLDSGGPLPGAAQGGLPCPGVSAAGCAGDRPCAPAAAQRRFRSDTTGTRGSADAADRAAHRRLPRWTQATGRPATRAASAAAVDAAGVSACGVPCGARRCRAVPALRPRSPRAHGAQAHRRGVLRRALRAHCAGRGRR